MKKPKRFFKKIPRKELIPNPQEIPKEQTPNKFKSRNILFWVIGGALLATILIAIAWFLSHKLIIGSTDSSDPYALLKNYDPEPEAVSKGTFEKLFPNGDEIFNWMMKNDYFYEKTGTSVHPRFITPEEKFNIKTTYYAEHKLILSILEQADAKRHQYVVKSAEVSVELTNQAIEALQKKDINKAIKDCNEAMSICPLNGKPYILLTKFYLMTGQEQKMYDILTLAGRSFPNFNNIISIVDDVDLDNIPMPVPQDNIYLADFPENMKTAISFLFDDGEKNVYVNALPIFDKYGYKATIPIVAGMVAKTDDDHFWGSWNEWRDAANRGFEIANHSMFHRDSKELHGDDFDISIDQAKKMIENNIGRKVTAYIFPHDSYDDEAVNRALKEHEVVRTMEFLQSFYQRTLSVVYGGPNYSLESANRMVDIAIKRHLWLVANCHGVTTKLGLLSFKSISPAFLENHLAYIHSKNNDIWVDTFTKIFEYMSRRSQTNIETKDFNTDSIDFILHNNKQVEKLSVPMTVIIKTQAGEHVKSVRSADGHALKEWSCASDKLCIDVDSYDQNIHVQW